MRSRPIVAGRKRITGAGFCAEAGLGGNYTTSYAYTPTNLISDTTFAPGGGLPGNDDMAMSYDELGNPASERGANIYVSQANYDSLNELSAYDLGYQQSASSYTIDRDPQTRRITETNFSAQQVVPQIDDTTYTYDPAGNLTSSTDTEGSAGAPVQKQCFGYDALDRLNQAWTTAADCNQTPTTAAITGVAPYWLSWSLDPAGLRQSQTQHALPGSGGGDTTTTYTYPPAGSPQPDTLTSTSTTGPNGTSTTSYGYDADGNTQTRTLPSGQQTLTWDAENHLAADSSSNGTSSYVYDADGNELVRHDPGSTTLFLPGEELVYDTTTHTVTGTRYYTFDGQTIAVRTGNTDEKYLSGDLNGTDQVVYNPDDGSVTRRPFDPYGNPIGSTTSTIGTTTTLGQWPDDRGYLNAPQDASTGLTDVGAREYDTTTGRFISIDPILNPANPQSLNGYTYSNDNPTTDSDPTGKMPNCVDVCSQWAAGEPGTYNPTIGKTHHSPTRHVELDPPGHADKSLVKWEIAQLQTQRDQLEQLLRELAYAKDGATCNSGGNPYGAGCETGAVIAGGGQPAAETEQGLLLALGSLCAAPVIDEICAAGPDEAEVDGASFLLSEMADDGSADALAAILTDANGEADLDRAITADNDAIKAEQDELNSFDSACSNSFPGGAGVLMADGSTKPISQVKVGDSIENADPGASPGSPDQHHTVTAVHVTYDDKSFTDVTVSTAAGSAAITSTAAHLYWDDTTRLWTPASRLRAGDGVQSERGVRLVVENVHSYSTNLVTYNLTVGSLHTYFVVAGSVSVLVHNNSSPCGGIALGLSEVDDDDQALADFADSVGAKHYQDWPGGTDNWLNQFKNYVADGKTPIHFNLDGIDDPVASADEGGDPDLGVGVTNWELGYIRDKPSSWSRTTFYRGGNVVDNPFASH